MQVTRVALDWTLAPEWASLRQCTYQGLTPVTLIAKPGDLSPCLAFAAELERRRICRRKATGRADPKAKGVKFGRKLTLRTEENPHCAKSRRKALMVRRLRLISGLILFVYVVTHFINHGLGIVSIAAMEAMLSVVYPFWSYAPVTLVLY